MAPRYSLYLVRHAIAADRGDQWPDDSVRPVTRQGAARMRRVVRGLAALDVKLDLILTSPLLRATQTAELLAAGLRPAPRVREAPALALGSTPAKVAELLGEQASAHQIALVGHEPALGELAAWLIGARTALPFKKGGVCRIDVPALPPGRSGQLVWLATPKMLRAVARA
jgi:phosphohistidine phosphatase